MARDESSWLIEGGTPIDDVMRVLDIDEFPQAGNYETIGGFMMYMLRKIETHRLCQIRRLQVRSGGYRQLQDRPAAGHPAERQTGGGTAESPEDTPAA